LTKAVALEQAQAGIRINAICPAFIETPMVDRLLNTEELHAHFLAGHPIGRFGKPEEVAAAVVWLCSPAASFITGHPLLIDGGFTVQ
jgi:NAD(P)-dependent dehydrogenase (short-subunit alcohol dehydrogenase family)